MFIRCTVLCVLLNVIFLPSFANDYEDAWKALHNNDTKTAEKLLLQAMNDPATGVDAYITYIFLRTFEGKESEASDYISRVYEKLDDPNPYTFALWFNGAALGDYGKKAGRQAQLLDRLLTDSRNNGSIRAAAHYFKAMHFQFSNDFSKAEKEWQKIGAAGPLWQLAGPFDNLSGSGYYKDYGPLQHPEANAQFTSVSNATIGWFTPTVMNTEGYSFPYPHFRRNTAIIYAQSFVYAPEDMKLLLNTGGSGSLKVWINDNQVMTAPKELLTELDYYRQEVHLRKGYNRLLVQLGYTDNTFPNFIIRFTDAAGNAVSGITYSAGAQPYTKDSPATGVPAPIKHFAESFFEEKIKAQPENIVNYILLSETYLRSKKTAEARKVIEDVLNRFPDNPLLRLELISTLLKENNRTLLLQEVERMKEKSPDCLLTVKSNISRLAEQEKYDEALKELDREVQLFGEDADTWTTRIRLYGKQNKTDDLIKAIQEGYAKYPESLEIVQMMFSLRINGYKDAKGAIKIYENYLKDNYNFHVVKDLAAEYAKQGMKDKALQLLEMQKNYFPYDADLYTNVSSVLYDQQDYKKAVEYGRQALALAPYVATYWENVGLELQQMHSDQEAIDAYRKAIYYDANKYSARERLRELQKKPSIWNAFPDTDVYKVIRQTAGKPCNYDYYYILDEKFAVVYPEGATEEYYTTVVRIVNQKGIDDWKEYNISYNSNSQDLSVEKAEVVKKNGTVTPAEKNDGDIVFTGLDTGDAIVLKYKVQLYGQGRLARHYWDRFLFNAFVPETLSRYCLLISNKVKFNYKMVNTSLQPTESSYDDFKLYTWQTNDPAIAKEESFMPPLGDIGPVVQVSTLTSWSDVATWYRDLSSSKTEDEFEVKQVFSTLFPDGAAKLSDREKAVRIYNYITKNIRYSSVSFRQGAYVPQKASVTINTRLGDCKDLSSLFVALAKLAGLKANLVLVDTRNNGQKSMELPSVEFNHCIVKTWIGGQTCFLELTDNDLPFASLPSNLYHASCLVIPSDNGNLSSGVGDVADARLESIESPCRTRDKAGRRVTVHIDGSNLKLVFQVTKSGALSSNVRSQFGSLSPDKQKEEMQRAVSKAYSNTVKVDSVSFSGLDELSDSASYRYTCTVQNEVTEVGNMHMLKIPLGDVIASVDNFSEDERNFPVEYWKYEDADEYETSVTIQAPAGTQFIELPKNESYVFRGSTYSIQYITRGPGELTVIRKATLQRDDVQPGQYKEMRDFFSKIVKAESKYIVFK